MEIEREENGGHGGQQGEEGQSLREAEGSPERLVVARSTVAQRLAEWAVDDTDRRPG